MSVTLTEPEVVALTGGYTQPAAQLRVLHERGYWRAVRSRLTGRIVLERAHAEAVARGDDQPRPGPKRRAPAPRLRAA